MSAGVARGARGRLESCFSLPSPSTEHSIGPYLAITDRDAQGEPYRFLDMGALIATHAFGERSRGRRRRSRAPAYAVRAMPIRSTDALSLRLKAELARIAPLGKPRHFVVNTGAEAVENAISRCAESCRHRRENDGGFVSRSTARPRAHAGNLAVTHRRRRDLDFRPSTAARVVPGEEPRSPKETARREGALAAIWETARVGAIAGRRQNREVFPP